MDAMKCVQSLIVLAALTHAVVSPIEIAIFLTDLVQSPMVSLFSTVRLSPVVDMALRKIARRVDSGQYANFSLHPTYSLTGCASPLRSSVGVAAELYFENNVAALFGPTCSSNALVVGHLAASLNLTMLSFGANDHELDEKTTYATLTQTTFKSTGWCPIVQRLCLRYRWKTIVVVRVESGFFALPSNSLEECLREAGIRSTIIHLDWYPDDPGRALVEAALHGRSKYRFPPNLPPSNFEPLKLHNWEKRKRVSAYFAPETIDLDPDSLHNPIVAAFLPRCRR